MNALAGVFSDSHWDRKLDSAGPLDSTGPLGCLGR